VNSRRPPWLSTTHLKSHQHRYSFEECSNDNVPSTTNRPATLCEQWKFFRTEFSGVKNTYHPTTFSVRSPNLTLHSFSFETAWTRLATIPRSSSNQRANESKTGQRRIIFALRFSLSKKAEQDRQSKQFVYPVRSVAGLRLHTLGHRLAAGNLFTFVGASQDSP